MIPATATVQLQELGKGQIKVFDAVWGTFRPVWISKDKNLNTKHLFKKKMLKIDVDKNVFLSTASHFLCTC